MSPKPPTSVGLLQSRMHAVAQAQGTSPARIQVLGATDSSSASMMPTRRCEESTSSNASSTGAPLHRVHSLAEFPAAWKPNAVAGSSLNEATLLILIKGASGNGATHVDGERREILTSSEGGSGPSQAGFW